MKNMSRDLQNICSRTKKKNTSRNFEIWVEKNGSRVEKKILESRKRERWPVVLSIDVFTSPIRVACENIRFSSLFVAGAVSRGIQVLVIPLGCHFISSISFISFPTRLALYFSTQISKLRLVFFVSFVNIYFANLDSYFLLHSMYFTSFDLSIMFSTCFYYRYNFVRNGTP